MTVEDKIKEIQSLINKIKRHSNALDAGRRLSALELSVIISKITKLHETALILKYLVKKDHGVNIDTCDENIDDEDLEDGTIRTENAQSDEPLEQTETTIKNTSKNISSVPKEKDAEINPTPKQEEITTIEKVSILEEITQDSEENQNTIHSTLPKEEDSFSMDKTEEQTISTDLNDKFSTDDDSSIGGHLQKQPINNLLSAIGLNERYLYASELFNGDMEDFRRNIAFLNDFESIEEAKAFFNNELKPAYGWEETNKLAIALYNLVERRYL